MSWAYAETNSENEQKPSAIKADEQVWVTKTRRSWQAGELSAAKRFAFRFAFADLCFVFSRKKYLA